jgi:hypothetical protein
MIADPMTAFQLSSFQRCPRRWRIEQVEPKGRWWPKALFDHLMRQAVFAISNGANAAETGVEYSIKFMEFAADPGLDVPCDPFPLARDFCCMIKTMCAALSGMVLLALEPVPVVSLTPDLRWRVASPKDQSGVLHRWCSVDRLDDDALARHLHSWEVFGDVAAADVPMVLHVVEIGVRRHGRQHGPWCRAYSHPAIPGRWAFQHRDGTAIGSGWQPVFLADCDQQDPEDWVALMKRDGVVAIHHLNVNQIPPSERRTFISEVSQESENMKRTMDDWRNIPRRRPSCDVPAACPWQWLCFKTAEESRNG